MRPMYNFPEMEYEFCVCWFPKVRLLACFLVGILLEMITYLCINLTDFDDSGDVLRFAIFVTISALLYVVMF